MMPEYKSKFLRMYVSENLNEFARNVNDYLKSEGKQIFVGLAESDTVGIVYHINDSTVLHESCSIAPFSLDSKWGGYSIISVISKNEPDLEKIMQNICKKFPTYEELIVGDTNRKFPEV